MSLAFPRAQFELTVAPPRGQGRPVSQGVRYLGSLFLDVDANGNNLVGVRLANLAFGSQQVTYSSQRARIGQIAGFSVTVSLTGQPNQNWVFDAITVLLVSGPNQQTRLYVFSSGLTIDSVPFVMSGLTGPIAYEFGPTLGVKEGNTPIGSLTLPASGDTGVQFTPQGSSTPIPVDVTATGIHWNFNNKSYSGFPVLFTIDTSVGNASVTGGYLGVATNSSGEPRDEDDWEASARGPVEEGEVAAAVWPLVEV